MQRKTKLEYILSKIDKLFDAIGSDAFGNSSTGSNWSKSRTYRFVKKHWKLILALVYLIFPLDIVPDFLFPFGYTEDIVLLVFAVVEYFLEAREKRAPTKENNSSRKED